MTFRNALMAATAVLLLGSAVPALAQQAPSAMARMIELGPENARMAQRVGTWDVVLTAWASPGAAPTTIRAVAKRRMIGQALQEIITYPRGADGVETQRLDLLSYQRVEGRWKYVSLDTRVPAGLMPAFSFGPGEDGRITLVFEPFAFPAPGVAVVGQLLSMDQVITDQGPDRDMKEQRFMLADGTGRMWLANRYAFTRRK
ncbi:DUF1579 domain-containing protein [Sphingomonas sp. PAMC 26605]|uniref:DUF1579 domain-containing protein n=1 Tax=Sphingomonas sp. PAMC 26605 TaxID=1112214 RepID=UPI001E2FD3D2|nr:DUF1579 domain-containing protein [Sphingomonas sp. PAMC 26605]